MSDEQRIVTTITEALSRRVAAGREVYGPLVLATDHRDWVEEAWEEALDLTVYLAAAREQVARLTESLRQKTEEADNLRASTVDLFRQRDEARRAVCCEYHDPSLEARKRGWPGLFPDAPGPEEEPKKADGWGRCDQLGSMSSQCEANGPPCYRMDDVLKRCGDCSYFEPEAKP